MFARLFGPESTAVLSPLIQEARDRQRRRRVALAQIAALAAVLGLAMTAAGHGGGSGILTLGNFRASDSAAAVSTDVTGVIAGFDRALARRDFTAACSLVDPGMGMTTVRTSTSDVGIDGTCEERLAGFVRLVGPGFLGELEHASLSDIQLGGSESRGYAAAALIHVPDRIVERGHWWPVVGVSKATAHSRVLITCPPLFCTWRFLNEYSLQRTGGRNSRL